MEEYVGRLGGPNYKVLKKVWEKWIKGEIKLKDPNPPKDFIEYLKRLDYSLWLWVTIALVPITIITIVLSTIMYLVLYIRYILGALFILFLPGYSFVEALYPDESSLEPLERVALSIGLSLALVPLIGLILNYMPWGIRLETILIAQSIFTLIMILIAAYRKYSLVTIGEKISETRIVVTTNKRKRIQTKKM